MGNTANLPTAISLANNANVTFSQAVSGTFSNAISGNGSLTTQGPGMLTITASNSYTDGTTIGGGTVKITNNFALGSGPITLAGGTLSLSSTTTTTGSIGIQFLYNNGTPITGSAGVAPMSNWNTLSGENFTNKALIDNSAAATTATLTTTGANNDLLGEQ